jgi:hypothetical protein
MQDRPRFSNHHEVELEGVCVEAVVQAAVNLALVHNDVPLVQAVSITNNSSRALADVTLTLNLDGRGIALAEPWSATSNEPIAAGGHLRWDTFAAFAPSYEHLSNLDESHPATLTVSVSRTWGADMRLTVPIQVLAHNEWLNSPVFYESLAAFVQPNTRAVSVVLDTASELLREHTGNASLAGYQQGAERASMIAAAIYEALRTREIRYVVPPASFEDTGQKVRTTAQVLEQRFGTCIDLSVTYAACLEQAGLHPLLWLIDGHAFTGYLREGGTLGLTVITEANAMINLVESGRAVPVEATFYEAGEPGSFAAAVAIARRHFSDPEALRGVIDVHATHRAGTRPLPGNDPLPILAANDDPAVDRGGSSPLTLPSELLVHAATDDVLLDTTDNAPARVRQWKRALLDLSTRNRLLNLRASGEVLDLHIPSDTLALLDDIVHEGTALTLLPQDELSDIQRLQGVRRAQDLNAEPVRKLLVEDHSVFVGVTEQAYVSRMRKLQRAARTLLEETGNANLYLTVGALVHRTPTGKDARAPLFLLPVKIEGGSGRSAFEVRVDATSVAAPNHCLVEWLRIKHGVQIDALENPGLDRSGIDIVSALPAIRDALVSHRLDMRIDEVATVAICQFSTFGMWRDLEHHWDVISRNPVVEHLALRPGETFVEPSGESNENDLEAISFEEAEIPLPIPADGSQLRAVAAASEGRSFVLEGPPGTGKSQTITNLIAHALANGKTVLFVAEKQAALEVVKRRLQAIGLADFTLDLHGRSQRPTEIRAQLKRAIDNGSVYDPRGWQAICATLRARHAPLEEYPQRIHARNGIGVSLWSAYENLRQYGEGPTAPIPASYVAATDTDETPVKDALRNFARAARTVGLCRAHPWSIVGRVSSDLDPRTLSDASAALEKARESLEMHPQALKLVQGLEDPENLDVLLPHLEDRVKGALPTAARLTEMRTADWTAACQRLTDELGRFPELHAVVLSVFTQSFLEHGETGGLSSAAELAEHGVFGKRKRAERFALTVAPLLAKDVTILPGQVPGLIMGIDAARTHAAALSAEMIETLGDCAPHPWSPMRPDSPATLAEATERIVRSERFQQSHSELWELIEQAGPPSLQDMDALRNVAAAWAQWRTLLGSGQEECSRWAAGRHWSAAWFDDAGAWSSEIADAADTAARRWARMLEILDPLNAVGLQELRNELLGAKLDAADAEVAYLRGVAAGSLRERANAGGLQGFDAALRGGEVDDLAAVAHQSRTEQTVALPAELLARRPYQSDRLSGNVAELRRRLDAKRRGLSFRQLIERYGEEILQAMPCFFVSPASLAQYVPPGAVTFDLVVFDEASQVGVPQAIGALGRGRAAVIVGDSQQMPPTSVGKVKAAEEADRDDDEETGVLEDLESILTECVESGLPRLWLSWHYRSQDESLIAFSNAFYYEGRLASLPSPGKDPTAGVEMRRLDGHFNREVKHEFRTNRIEAEAIVDEIRRRLADPDLSDQTIGVVTFNAQQRDLVLNLLEECGDPLVARQLREDATEGIFVKNLENVQGDERDVVLFSIAFSKKHDGGPLPMNFGPLGTAGGEKRLNVAITRARRKVLLFVSFEPTDIDLSRTSSKGIAHLRSYLEMAEHGPGSLPKSQSRAVIGTDHVREAIADAIRGRGYDVECDFGLSDFSLDLVVRDSGVERWQVAIVLDGPRWAERPTVADRELTPLLLERLMDWGALLRLWLPEWLADEQGALGRIDGALQRARDRAQGKQAERAAATAARELAITAALADKSETKSEAERDASREATEDEIVEVETYTFTSAEERDEQLAEQQPEPALLVASAGDAAVEKDRATAPKDRDLHARGGPYQETNPTILGTRDDLGRTTSPEVRQTIAAAVRDTVESEGPIATGRLARSIGRRFGFDRVTSGRQRFILEAVPAELVKRTTLGEFVWPTGLDNETWRGYRATPAAISRPLTDIAPEELINAMADTANASRYIDEHELYRATMLVFGQRRLTSQTIARLEACRRLGEERSRLIRAEEGGWRGGA